MLIAQISQGCALWPFGKKDLPTYTLSELEKFYQKKDYKQLTKAAVILLALDEFKEGEKGRTYFLLGAGYQNLNQELKAKHYFKSAIYEGYEFSEDEETLATQARTELKKLEDAKLAYAAGRHEEAWRILNEVRSYQQDDRDKMEAFFMLGLVTYYIQNQSSVSYDEFFRLALQIDINFEPRFEMGPEERRIWDPIKNNYSPPGWWSKNWWKVGGGVVAAGVVTYFIWPSDASTLPPAPDFPGKAN
ncbi:hypothetical protein KC799_08235 [candidate division KSB1 bacterium]|nr:hypothetical protein [candidate division KSB1 bacterium]